MIRVRLYLLAGSPFAALTTLAVYAAGRGG